MQRFVVLGCFYSSWFLFSLLKFILSNLFDFQIFDIFQTNQEKINIIKTQKHFSKSFNILLNPKSIELDSTMIDASNLKGSANGNDRTKQLRQYLSNVIQTETEATENRIDQYTKQQMATLKSFRERAERDFYDILR